MRLLALLFLSLPAFAQVDSFVFGEELAHSLSICVSKESALAIIDVDVREGLVAARKAYAERDDCATLPVGGANVGKVVKSAKVKRDDAEVTVSVVEIVKDGKVVAYFLTSVPVVARLQVEPKRGSNS